MKEHFNLINFLKTSIKTDGIEFEEIEFLLGEKIYYYGDHFKYPSSDFKFSIKQLLVEYLKLIYYLVISLFYRQSKFDVVSSSYFGVDNELLAIGYSVARPPWSAKLGFPILGGFNIILKTFILKKKIRRLSFNQILDYNFNKFSFEYDCILESWLQKSQVKAIIVTNDISFFERKLIRIAKKNNIPSFIFLHGLPARYNIINDNRTDYLIVWGDKIKEYYENTGFKPDKIIVSGHPNYNLISKVDLLPSSFDDVLVLTKAINGNHPNNEVVLGDRGNSILYLLSVERVLKNIGVNRVRYRPHPSENIKWYMQYLDPDFFIPDTSILDDSIQKATLIIGPTSTLFLECLFSGKNYVIYELCNGDLDILNQKLVPPFDGSEINIPVAKSESELHSLLIENKRVESKILEFYFKSNFDLSFTKYFKKIEK
jgi:hypothetical protein